MSKEYDPKQSSSEPHFPPLPGDGEWHLPQDHDGDTLSRPSQVSFAPKDDFLDRSSPPQMTVVLVHPFGVNKDWLKPHIRWLTQQGYKCVSFSLSRQNFRIWKEIPWCGSSQWGYVFIWAQEISAILNAVPGAKIIFSFSSPSMSALQAISQRKAEDIVALIADGGPFVDFRRNVWNLLGTIYRVRHPVIRWIASYFGAFVYGPRYKKQLLHDLNALPSDFPILSLRGAKDTIVPEESIKQAFQQAESDVDLKVVLLPHTRHLDGLRRDSETYRSAVLDFLEKTSKS